jgi:hypothetical protein
MIDEHWYHACPRCVQRRIDAYPPDRLYRLRSTRHIVPIYAYNVDGKRCDTCKVKILRVNNPKEAQWERVVDVVFSDLVMIPDDMRRGGT